ncbi:uncharacterized protein [Aegilops tauschii subsp. strangulata]|uniref:uncharacterized protein n=1 Tax=Aegilops tauschii subsp. strangulata TaxID=200361 RepID=UPI001E1C9FA2|nr:uncharacterized protein LOC123497496 [Aegilops tauschii subsp. strangulata]
MRLCGAPPTPTVLLARRSVTHPSSAGVAVGCYCSSPPPHHSSSSPLVVGSPPTILFWRSTLQLKMFSILETEHDEELNEKDDTFMSIEVEADAEAAAAEASDESVWVHFTKVFDDN